MGLNIITIHNRFDICFGFPLLHDDTPILQGDIQTTDYHNELIYDKLIPFLITGTYLYNLYLNCISRSVSITHTPSSKWLTGYFILGLKRHERDADYSFSSSDMGKKDSAAPSHPQTSVLYVCLIS
jgi:hypothetical protein